MKAHDLMTLLASAVLVGNEIEVWVQDAEGNQHPINGYLLAIEAEKTVEQTGEWGYDTARLILTS